MCIFYYPSRLLCAVTKPPYFKRYYSCVAFVWWKVLTYFPNASGWPRRIPTAFSPLFFFPLLFHFSPFVLAGRESSEPVAGHSRSSAGFRKHAWRLRTVVCLRKRAMHGLPNVARLFECNEYCLEAVLSRTSFEEQQRRN